MEEDKYICPKCGNKKYFYVDVVVQGRIRFNPKTEESYGKVYNIDKRQYDAYPVVYCKECDEIVDSLQFD